MARVVRDYWIVSYAFYDNNGKYASTTARFDGALDWDEVQAAADSLGTDLQDVSNAQMRDYVISREVRETAPPASVAESEVERKLRIPLNSAEYQNISSMEIPSPVFSLEQQNTDVVSTLNPLLIQLAASITNGGLGGGNGVQSAYGQDIISIGVATIVHRTRKPKR